VLEEFLASTKKKKVHQHVGSISIDQDEGLGMRLGNMRFTVQNLRNLLERLATQGRDTIWALVGRSVDPDRALATQPTQSQKAIHLMALVGVKEASLHKIHDFIRDEGGEILMLDTTALNDGYPIARAKPDHVIIDIESAGGIASAYSALRRFRDHHPDIPVILLSDEFSTDDFGTNRLALCDISLRTPFSFATLDFAMREAEVNNKAWQQRQVDLSQARRTTR
jgi:CheY-like chemotaxis protein